MRGRGGEGKFHAYFIVSSRLGVVGCSPTFAYWREVGYQTRTVFVQAATGDCSPIRIQHFDAGNYHLINIHKCLFIQCTAVARELYGDNNSAVSDRDGH